MLVARQVRTLSLGALNACDNRGRHDGILHAQSEYMQRAGIPVHPTHDGQTFVVGSLTSPFDNDAPWDFSTSSGQNGLYQHGLGGDQWFGDGEPQFAFGSGTQAEGLWTFSFFQTLGGGIGWEDVTITLHHAVPAPSTMVLLALFGLAGRTRRRSA